MIKQNKKKLSINENRNKNSSIKSVVFKCISCDIEYNTIGMFEKNSIEISNCSNCCPFYTGKSSSDIKFGRVEKFYSRSKKNK